MNWCEADYNNSDNDDDNDDIDGACMKGQSVIKEMIMQKGKKEDAIGSEPYAAQSFEYERFDDYRVEGWQLKDSKIAQFGSCARTARGEVLIIQSFRCYRSPNTLDVHECNLIHMFMHIFVQEHIPTYAHVAMWLKRFETS